MHIKTHFLHKVFSKSPQIPLFHFVPSLLSLFIRNVVLCQVPYFCPFVLMDAQERKLVGTKFTTTYLTPSIMRRTMQTVSERNERSDAIPAVPLCVARLNDAESFNGA